MSAHVAPVRKYLVVYGALLVLTLLTVGVSYLGLPPTPSLSVAMAIAAVKAALVAAIFMHLKDDAPFNSLVLLGAVWFALLFFILTVVDLGTRGSVLPVQDNFVLRAERAAAPWGVGLRSRRVASNGG